MQLMISSAALARRSGDTVFGAAVMISPVRRASSPSPMCRRRSPSVMIPASRAVAIDHAETAEGLLGHDHDGLAHEAVGGRERQAVALMHQVADEFQPGAELAAGMQNT